MRRFQSHNDGKNQQIMSSELTGNPWGAGVGRKGWEVVE
jgi:hypothetical protein